MELCTRRVPGQTWVRVGVCRRTPDFEPGHAWLYVEMVRRDAWVLGPLAFYVMRMPDTARAWNQAKAFRRETARGFARWQAETFERGESDGV